jgi:hypothetical protein
VTKSKDPIDWREVPPPLRVHSSGKVEILPYPKLARNVPNFVTVNKVTFIERKKERFKLWFSTVASSRVVHGRSHATRRRTNIGRT